MTVLQLPIKSHADPGTLMVCFKRQENTMTIQIKMNIKSYLVAFIFSIYCKQLTDNELKQQIQLRNGLVQFIINPRITDDYR